MGRLVTLVRSGTLIVITAGLALGSTACSSFVPKDDVASVVGSELQKQGVTIDAGVTCPEDLEAEVGRSIRCEFTSDGQPVDAVASVTSVQDGKANFDIVTEARPIPQALLAQQIGDQIGQDAGVVLDSSTCAGDLQPRVAESVICTLTGGGETADFKVTVTAVDGGAINYSIEPA
jgi:Domain of unknown function (DUF4333)